MDLELEPDHDKVLYISKKVRDGESEADPVLCQFIENELEIVAGKSSAFLLEGEEVDSDEEEVIIRVNFCQLFNILKSRLLLKKKYLIYQKIKRQGNS